MYYFINGKCIGYAFELPEIDSKTQIVPFVFIKAATDKVVSMKGYVVE